MELVAIIVTCCCHYHCVLFMLLSCAFDAVLVATTRLLTTYNRPATTRRPATYSTATPLPKCRPSTCSWSALRAARAHTNSLCRAAQSCAVGLPRRAAPARTVGVLPGHKQSVCCNVPPRHVEASGLGATIGLAAGCSCANNFGRTTGNFRCDQRSPPAARPAASAQPPRTTRQASRPAAPA